jgi:DNA invertase Pin-like site-specific DNA recombinase
LSGNIDTTSSDGKFNFHIFGELLELERNLRVGLAATMASTEKAEENQ